MLSSLSGDFAEWECFWMWNGFKYLHNQTEKGMFLPKLKNKKQKAKKQKPSCLRKPIIMVFTPFLQKY